MKNKPKLYLLGIISMLMINCSLKAQTYPFVNNLSCDVVVCYEMRKTGCGVCTTGCFTVTAGATYNLPLCAGYSDMCFWVGDVGGCTPQGNHASFNVCHILIPYGQAGTNAGSCPGCANYSWTIQYNGSSWRIF
jgi:hypothetical protein